MARKISLSIYVLISTVFYRVNSSSVWPESCQALHESSEQYVVHPADRLWRRHATR